MKKHITIKKGNITKFEAILYTRGLTVYFHVIAQSKYITDCAKKVKGVTYTRGTILSDKHPKLTKNHIYIRGSDESKDDTIANLKFNSALQRNDYFYDAYMWLNDFKKEFNGKDENQKGSCICWFDGSENSYEVCEMRRISAKKIHARGKELPMPQCLQCKEGMAKKAGMITFDRRCSRCGANIDHRQVRYKLCVKCSKASWMRNAYRKNNRI